MTGKRSSGPWKKLPLRRLCNQQRVVETATFGYWTGTSGTQEELDGEIVFTNSEGDWGVSGIRDNAFGWQERETENLDQ